MFRSLFSLLQASCANNTPETNRGASAHIHLGTQNSTPTSEDAQRVIDESLREMERVIARLDSAKASAQAERNESVAMLQSYKTAYDDLRQRAKSLVQAGQNEAARELLAEQQSLETVIASFERIAGNMTQTVQKLAVQLDSMRVQREELKAQRTVFAAQLASATSQEEFLEKLRATGASHELLEREQIHAELRAVPTDAHHDFAALATDTALAALESQIQNEMAQERAEKERMMNEAGLKRFQVAFVHAEKAISGKTGNTHSAQQQPQPISPTPNAAETEHKQRLMNDFFASSPAKQETQNASKASSATDSKSDSAKNSTEKTDNRITDFFLQHP